MLRNNTAYFSEKEPVPDLASCPRCKLMWNQQSLELLAFKQHVPVHNRRTIVVVIIPTLHDVGVRGGRGVERRMIGWECKYTTIHSIA